MLVAVVFSHFVTPISIFRFHLKRFVRDDPPLLEVTCSVTQTASTYRRIYRILRMSHSKPCSQTYQLANSDSNRQFAKWNDATARTYRLSCEGFTKETVTRRLEISVRDERPLAITASLG